jgi:SAM-dependent methyltransferase
MGKSGKQDYVKLFYKELPKQCDPEDFWGQVKRTVNGKPITKDQIDLIVETVGKALDLDKTDNLLDIGCGNGALSALLFKKVGSIVGVDFSEYLIGVAKKNFEERPRYTFHLGDAYKFIVNYRKKEQITKALCYGTFAYFNFKVAEKMLSHLYNEYDNLTRVFLGNLPDKEKAAKFFYKDIDYASLLDDPKSAIGIWRSREEMKKLAMDCGWKVKFNKMPKKFHGSHYRYDVILIR